MLVKIQVCGPVSIVDQPEPVLFRIVDGDEELAVHEASEIEFMALVEGRHQCLLPLMIARQGEFIGLERLDSPEQQDLEGAELTGPAFAADGEAFVLHPR